MISWLIHTIQWQTKLEGKIQLSFKFVLLSFTVVMVCVLTGGTIVNYWKVRDAFEDSMKKRYQDEVQHIVEMMIASIEATVPSGTIIGQALDAETQDRVKRLIRASKVGLNGYCFMFDDDGIVIAQGIEPENAGINRLHAKDEDGVHHILLLRDAARRGGGFVHYKWRKRDGGGPDPKIAYAKMLRGNKWWVASGVYVDAIKEDSDVLEKRVLLQFVIIMILSGGFLAAILWVAVGLSRMLAKQITGPIAKLVTGANTLSAGKYGYRVEVDTQDEFKDLADAFNAMDKSIGQTMSNEKTAREEGEKYLERLRAATENERTLVEAERKRIAGELHDDIGQKLLKLRTDVENAQMAVEDESQQALLDRMIQSIKDTNDAIREIMQDLRPRVLDDLGLFVALRVDLEKQAESANITLGYYNRVGELSVPPEVEINVFRIFQQAMANVVQHAEARRVDVWIRSKGKMLEVCLHDDGQGFDVDARIRRPGSHFGLINMKERGRSFGGTVEIVSNPSVEGTRVKVSIPLTHSVCKKTDITTERI